MLGGLQSCREPCTPAPSPAPHALHSPPHPHPNPEAQAPPGAQSCHRFAKQQRWPGAGAGFGRVGRTELEFWVGSRAGRSRSRADSSQLGRAGCGCYSSPAQPPARTLPRETRAAAPGESRGVRGRVHSLAWPLSWPLPAPRTRPDSPAPRASAPRPTWPELAPGPCWWRGRRGTAAPGSRAASGTGSLVTCSSRPTRTPARGLGHGLCRPGPFSGRPPRGRTATLWPLGLSRRDDLGRQGCGHPHLGWHKVTPGLKSRVCPVLLWSPERSRGPEPCEGPPQSSFVQILGRTLP